METITASDFKARCLAILDHVQRTGERIAISKRGSPVAELGPASHAEGEFPQRDLRGTVTVPGDLLAPALPAADWESLAE
ncbi:MAG: type II toxin-antitoxin system Phd/YefM family antitoxin [Gammaproteobacteria bacterium]|nr:type II toxin-antitoxin system Phd/YefM family antitoxin [Gammaproteobacteria bacterium]MXW46548.1 type II toxin-antitoxin system Phd/YefM family antitoxin [Gammaproteobacteria bacterium]MYD01536.1 type II toxin-antitoxin system Phd/YefM family antitoxin [Gammaproteobacteria bacterium]MYI26283.1 type II toxin-antitoxin system Phd/YefM family antitoxin [Gammaproteobacteria bacterium]